jgi:6-phosphogluconate dehydrogenase (decarboxylating)
MSHYCWIKNCDKCGHEYKGCVRFQAKCTNCQEFLSLEYENLDGIFHNYESGWFVKSKHNIPGDMIGEILEIVYETLKRGDSGILKCNCNYKDSFKKIAQIFYNHGLHYEEYT